MKALLVSLLLTLSPSVLRADESYRIRPDQIYGRKLGMALTLDVVHPKGTPNGAGVLFMVSGGWVSGWVPPQTAIASDYNRLFGFGELLDKGFTIFIVRHGSSPRFKVPEAIEDVRRAVRFVRANAGEYGIDANRLGVFGGSAGGHLSLMLGTTSDNGRSDARDPIDRASTRVAAVAAIFPPSELKSYLEDEKMRQQFPALQFDAATWKDVSPIEHVTPDDAPALLLHGDADTLVPDRHSRAMREALQSKGVATELIVFAGAGHGFSGEHRDRARTAIVAWFETHLAQPKGFDLAGAWKVTARRESGDPLASTLRFSRNGDGWKARAEWDGGGTDLDHVALADRTLNLRAKISIDSVEGTVHVNAEAKGPDRFDGRWRIEGTDGAERAQGEWQAVRDRPAVAAAPKPDNALTGEWEMEIQLGDQRLDYRLRIAERDGKLAGTLVSPRSGEYPCESVTLEGANVSIRIKRKFDENPATFHYTGKVENGAVSGTFKVEEAPDQFNGTWSAKRTATAPAAGR